MAMPRDFFLMSIGLHLRIIGRLGRIGGLEKILTHMTTRGAHGSRRDDVARYWIAHCQ